MLPLTRRHPSIKVNGKTYRVEIDPETPLLWYLRDHLGLMGTKYSCGIAECGACTVHVDGEAVLSCVTPVEDVFGMEVTTIEGLEGDVAGRLFEAWTMEDVPQCGYCQPGQIMTAAAFLSQNPNRPMRKSTMPCRACCVGAAPIRPSERPSIGQRGCFRHE